MKVVAAVYVSGLNRMMVVCEDGTVYWGMPTATGVHSWQKTKTVGSSGP